MDFLVLLRRSLIVALAVATGAALAVAGLHDWFHETLLPYFDIHKPWGDAIGTFVVLMLLFVCLRLLSISFYRDWLFGLGRAQTGQYLVAGAAQFVHQAGELFDLEGVLRGNVAVERFHRLTFSGRGGRRRRDGPCRR